MPNPVTTTVSDAAGRTLATLTAALSHLRHSEKPLHPVGQVFAGRLVRPGSDEHHGVPWFDHPGEDEVLVRVSHAIGLPKPIPDINGLAIRMRKGQMRYGDVLLATTGWDPVTRHLLVPAFNQDWPLTTLLPYRSPMGPVVLGARPIDERGYELTWARVGKGWHHLGELTLDDPLPDEDEVSFDPVLNTLPGLDQYRWVERLRERSYATARAHRRAG
jgi:hypothetical protein